MKELFEFEIEEIQSKKKKWLALFVASLFLYVALVLVFILVEQRSTATVFLILTYIFTALEVAFALFYLLYKSKRLKRYERLLSSKGNVTTETYVLVKEKDYSIQDGLPFRTIVFSDEKGEQEYTFYLISSFQDKLTPNKRYSIQHVGGTVYAIGENDEE